MSLGRAVLKVLVLSCIFLGLFGCAGVKERHYFGSFVEPTLDNPTGLVNVFKVDIEAQGGWSSLRYIAGVYDERAVEYFLNETKSSTYQPQGATTAGLPKIFDLSCNGTDGKPLTATDCKTQNNAKLAAGSLAAGVQQGSSFVIILSSDANAISETIGSIAENEIMVKSVNYLLNKDTIDEASEVEAVKVNVEADRMLAFKTLGALMGESYKSNESKEINDELFILKIIANEVAPSKSASFTNATEARAWFAGIQ